MFGGFGGGNDIFMGGKIKNYDDENDGNKEEVRNFLKFPRVLIFFRNKETKLMFIFQRYVA